jgi:hypothetical protein
MAAKEAKPNWAAVKTKLSAFDQKGLLGLIRDLYEASKENQLFLHTRFGVGEDVLRPYKETLTRWLSPDVSRKQNTSVSKAKQAISSYKKAIGDPAGVAELLVFYCEESSDFCADGGGLQSDVNALIQVFEQAVAVSSRLPPELREHFHQRLQDVSEICNDFGYGVGEHMGSLLQQYLPEESE